MCRSNLRLLSFGLRWVIVLLVALLVPPRPALGRDSFDDLAAEQWGKMLGEAIEEGTKAYAELVAYCAKESAQIAAAREKFKKAADGEATDAAWKELEALLKKKELGYLMLAAIQGIDKPPASEMFRQRGSISVLALSGDIDGGIPGQARQAFARTVADMRAELKKMGCEVEGVDALLFVPNQFDEATEKCKEQWSAYERRRERLEYQQARKPMPPVSDPRIFVIWDLQSQKNLSLEDASKEYDALAAAVGQESMSETVAAVAASPQDYRGHLTPEGLAKLGLISSTDVPKDQSELVGGKTADGMTVVWGTRPMSVLRGLWSRDNHRVAAMFTIVDAWLIDYALAWQKLQRIEAALGKERLESALKEFHSTPRQAKNGWLVTPIPPGDRVWMYRPFGKLQALLLAGDDARAQVRYFIAMDPDTSTAAAIDQKYQELAKLKGEQELLASVQKLRAADWKPRTAGVPTDRVVRALEKMLGLKGELNPHYLQWAGFGPGTTATYEIELHGLPAVNYRAPTYKKREVSVVSATKDGVTLRVTESEPQPDGSWTASPPKIETLPAYQDPPDPGRADAFWAWMPFVPGGWLLLDPLGSEAEWQESQSVIVDDEVIECTRSVWAGQPSQRDVEDRDFTEGLRLLMRKNLAEVCANRQVPGWVVKAMRAGRNKLTLIRLTSFETKLPAEQLAAEVANGFQSLAWMRSPQGFYATASNPDLPKGLDAGSRAWMNAPVGTSVTHRFFYKGPSPKRSALEEEVDARVVSTLIHKDQDVALVRSVWQQGDGQTRANFEIGPAMADRNYVADLVTWLGSNRRMARPLDLSGQSAASVTVTIDSQAAKAVEYHHVPLPPEGHGLRAEQLVLCESIPGAIVYLSVRTDPGTGGVPLALTYSLEGFDLKSLPEFPKLAVKPKGGNYAVEQELMIEKNGKWERGKILRFTQLRDAAGGRYLIQVGRHPTWYNEDWLREHSRPLSDEGEAAAAASETPQGQPSPGEQSPPSRDVTPPPPGNESKDDQVPSRSFDIGSKVRFESRGTLLDGTVIQVRGEGRRQIVQIEYRDPRLDRTRKIWVPASTVQELSESK